MKGTIETPRVAKLALSLLSHLFYDVIFTLEQNNGQVVFSKQLAIKKCMKDVQDFILTHPYGIFNIEVLDSMTRDIENPMIVIKFKNFTEELTSKIPLVYHIILDETYTSFEAYQSSTGDVLIRIHI
jgi:hypothetical protein